VADDVAPLRLQQSGSDAADALLLLLASDPVGARERSMAMASEARTRGDHELEARLLRVAGFALEYEAKVPEALAVLRRATRIAAKYGDCQTVAQCRVSLAFVEMITGHGGTASEATIRSGVAALRGRARADALIQLGYALERLARWDEAVGELNRALRILRRTGPAELMGFALTDRAICHAYPGGHPSRSARPGCELGEFHTREPGCWPVAARTQRRVCRRARR